MTTRHRVLSILLGIIVFLLQLLGILLAVLFFILYFGRMSPPEEPMAWPLATTMCLLTLESQQNPHKHIVIPLVKLLLPFTFPQLADRCELYQSTEQLVLSTDPLQSLHVHECWQKLITCDIQQVASSVFDTDLSLHSKCDQHMRDVITSIVQSQWYQFQGLE